MSVEATGKKYFPPVAQAVYDRGYAVGMSDITNDFINFRFRDEIFEIPALMVMKFTKWNGYWYEIGIDDLRRIEAEMAGGK